MYINKNGQLIDKFQMNNRSAGRIIPAPVNGVNPNGRRVWYQCKRVTVNRPKKLHMGIRAWGKMYNMSNAGAEATGAKSFKIHLYFSAN